MVHRIKVLFLIIFSLGLSNSYSQNEGTISFEEEEYDFGEIMQGDTVSHTFVFINQTKEPVEILDVVTQCGCTFSEQDTMKTIEPGEKGTLKISFDSKDKEGIERKAIKVKFSDFTTQKLIILINVLSEEY